MPHSPSFRKAFQQITCPKQEQNASSLFVIFDSNLNALLQATTIIYKQCTFSVHNPHCA